MQTLKTQQQFDRATQQSNAIIFVDFDWSGQAQLSKLVVSEWERTWAVWNPRVSASIWIVCPDDQPWVVECLPKDSRDNAGAGHGAVLWLRDGRIVGQERSAYATGVRELARRTNELLNERAADSAASVRESEVLTIDVSAVTTWDDFHSHFARALGFPEFYGRNMNAWIDCMTDADDPDNRMSRVTVRPGRVLTLCLIGIGSLALRCPGIYSALVDAVAFVNWRRIERGQHAVLALSYDRCAT
jgi:hypothetical protein